jgi:hypothetical protein
MGHGNPRGNCGVAREAAAENGKLRVEPAGRKLGFDEQTAGSFNRIGGDGGRGGAGRRMLVAPSLSIGPRRESDARRPRDWLAGNQ